LLSDRNARLAAARRLTRRAVRRDTGRFLAEGAPAVQSALCRPETVVEIFATSAALERHGGWLHVAQMPVHHVSDAAAASLSETVTPQGVVAVCHRVDVTFEAVVRRRPRLIAALVEPRDPGNVGTILRTADAAGADAVVLCGAAVDLYNGKTVRASAGSLFHLDIATDVPLAALPGAGLAVLATTGSGAVELDVLIDDGSLARPTTWLFGTEAHGLPSEALRLAERTVRVPIYGKAESLNLAAAAAVCLYASARAQRGHYDGGRDLG
jgi:RNA methyltransferase, TrmH family